MRYRLTITAAVAVVAASFSLFTVIDGAGWLWAGLGAAAVAAGAGLVTRLGGIATAATATGLTVLAAMPLLTGQTWPERIAGLALAALVAASLAARRVLTALAGAAVYLAGLFLYLNLAFAASGSWAWLVPTGTSVSHLGHLLSQGYAERIYAPPVPGIPGLELIAATGIGLVAVITDLIAVRLRSPAVAGLPLLVLFSVPVATNAKDTGLGMTLAFCLGISGYLALLAADGRERLRLWGRLVTVWHQAPAQDEDSRGPDTHALAASGRRIGLAAVAVAVVLPLALPAVRTHGLFGSNPAPGGTGGSLQAAGPAPLVLMQAQLRRHAPVPVLTYRTTASHPAQQYLRMYVMNYDGKSAWRLQGRNPNVSVAGESLPPAPGVSPDTDTSTSRTTISIGKNLASGPVSYLPAPYAPVLVDDEGAGWQETANTLMIYGFRPDAGLKYTVTSKMAQPSAEQLGAGGRIPAAIKKAYLGYPGPDRARLTRIAARLTAGARTPFGKAVTLENYFTTPGNFTYALRGRLPKTVLQFLTTDRRGFCQQFAFAMAVLARLDGIPSRVAVGYTAGLQQRDHSWRVTTAQAHAWPELYFPGAGWLRFEPTPGGTAGQGTATRPAYLGSTALPGANGPLPGQSAPSAAAGGGAVGAAGGIKKPISLSEGQTAGGRARAPGGFPVALVVLLVIAAALVTPAAARIAVRRRRWLRASDDTGRARAAWGELGSDLADYRLDGAPSESPRALARRVAGAADLDDPARAAVNRIARAEERSRYAPAPADGGSLASDVRVVRRALARQATGGQRWRARLVPASVLRPAGARLREAADVFGWLDAAGLRLRRAVLGTGRRPRRAG